MAEVIRMPRMSDTMEEGVIVKWHKKVGDQVKMGDLLAEVETDKATMELESYNEGVLLYIGVKEGEAVPVEGLIAIVGEEGEDISAIIEEEKKRKTKSPSSTGEVESTPESGLVDSPPESVSIPAENDKAAETLQPPTVEKPTEPPTPTVDDGRIKASPLARKLAKEHNIDLRLVRGTGDDGRIIKRDILAYLEKGPTLAVSMVESFEDVPVSQMRKTIAKRLSQSKFSAPHFYLNVEVNMDRVVDLRQQINTIAPVKISFNDIIIKACALALRQHPKVNASWLGDKIRYYKHVHIGMAVAVEEGLLVPVIKFADAKPLSEIAIEARALAEKAHERKLQPSDWEGNTFTVSNLGMFGIDSFTAIINPPDACILAVGAIEKKPIIKDGAFTAAHLMKVTLSCDHRVVDGATGAKFLQTLKDLLENPLKIVIQGTV